MATRKDILGTKVCPKDFGTASRCHGRHFARYLLAGQFAAGKVAVDAACGSGYGAAYMAAMAAFVLGLDLDQELIAYARATWQKPNLRFEHHDLHEPIRLTELAGLVTSFETLEHVRDPHRCLSNLANALADEGLAIVSVPNGIKELHSARPKDYHQVHFTADEFHRLLTEQFEWVEERSELFQPSLGYRLGKLLGKKGHLAKYYRFVPGFLDQAKTWLALCRSPRRR